MNEAYDVVTPMFNQCKLTKHGTNVISYPLLNRSIVSALQYVKLTLPDIAFSINKACQFMESLLESHWSTVKHILRYLSGTTTHGHLLAPAKHLPKFSLRAYNDSNWTSDLDGRHSTSSSCVFFGPNILAWSFKKQLLVA